VELLDKKPIGECWFVDEFKLQGMRIYSYEYHFLKPIYGEIFPTYDVLEHISEYKKMLVNDGFNKEFNQNIKLWYHILTGIYLIQNGKYELTEEQIKNVRLCHGKKMTPELYNYIQEQLSIYKEEFVG
jgi:hypothetical protein